MYHFDGGADGGRGCVWEGARGAHGKSLCLPRNFALNLKLLLKKKSEVLKKNLLLQDRRGETQAQSLQKVEQGRGKF